MDKAISWILRKGRVLFCFRSLIQKVPRHFQVSNNRVLIIEIDDDMLANASRPDDSSTIYFLAKRCERIQDLLAPPSPKLGNCFTGNMSIELANNGLYFGKFWHISTMNFLIPSCMLGLY